MWSWVGRCGELGLDGVVQDGLLYPTSYSGSAAVGSVRVAW